jgi:hypothetical protein
MEVIKMKLFAFGIVSLSCFSLFCVQADDNFPLGGEISIALDTFRSLPDGSWGGNMGAYLGLNLAYAFPKAGSGNGVQGGWSYGVYDWDGRGSTDSKSVQQEAFFTLGLFHKAMTDSGVNVGAVYDFSVNSKAGVFGLSPTMQQVRGQIGYLLKKKNEFGLWGTYGTTTSTQSFSGIPVKFRAISQVNVYWRHIFKNQGETMLWAGTPYRKGLMFNSGRPGNYIIGASFRAPLTSSFSLDGHGMYMGARSGSGFDESKNYAANVAIALTYSFGGKKGGAKPYLPVANNSNFIADTNLGY